jgi:hypothetical protein
VFPGPQPAPADDTQYRPNVVSDGVSDVIGHRRAVHAAFNAVRIDSSKLNRIPTTAHAAPTVGTGQPWDVVITTDQSLEITLHAHVMQGRNTYEDSPTGAGWVTFSREPFLGAPLDIPPAVRPVAWLCVGGATAAQRTPHPQQHGWFNPAPLSDFAPLSGLVHYEHYDGASA